MNTVNPNEPSGYEPAPFEEQSLLYKAAVWAVQAAERNPPLTEVEGIKEYGDVRVTCTWGQLGDTAPSAKR